MALIVTKNTPWRKTAIIAHILGIKASLAGRTIVNYQHQINYQNTVQSHERTRQLGGREMNDDMELLKSRLEKRLKEEVAKNVGDGVAAGIMLALYEIDHLHEPEISKKE